jgi:soluble lytic murein transglycosylase-like protein
MKVFLALIFSLTGFAASADQCDWNSASDASAARQLISLNKEVMFYCQLCGDSKPSFIAKVESVKTAPADSMSGQKNPYRIVVLSTSDRKEQEVDLAYLYVRTGSNIFSNVAQLVGCPSDGAITFIETTNRNQKIQHYYDDAGKRHDTAVTTSQNGTGGTTGRTPASKK